MKVYITKYALTRGILEIEAERCTHIDSNMISEIGAKYPTCYHGEGKEWHLHKNGASEYANVMRQNKIKNLQKQIDKLQKLKF